ncbi:MAG: secretin N-terminal domain-containing protein [Opitutales bacterium]
MTLFRTTFLSVGLALSLLTQGLGQDLDNDFSDLESELESELEEFESEQEDFDIEEPEQESPPPAPPETEAPGLIPPAEEADPSEMVERLMLRDESLDQVLSLLERFTGRSVIRPQALPTPTFTFNSQRELTLEEAILALESLLTINGIAISPMGDKFINVVPMNQVQSHAPELIIDPASSLPASGRIVSKLYQLQFLQIEEFEGKLAPLLTANIGGIITFEKSESLLITDTVRNLQRIEFLIAEMDKPSDARLETIFFNLNHAQAGEVVARINSLQSAELERRLSGDTVIDSDERTNQVILIIDPRQSSFFEDLIEKMDIAAAPRTRNEVIRLKHADAQEVVSVLSQLVAGQGGTGQGVTGQRQQQNGRQAPAQPNGQQQPGQPNGQINGQASTQGNGGDSAALEGILSQTAPEILETIDELSSEFSSILSIFPDERSNSVIISGTQQDIDLLTDLIQQIDVLLPQVRIDVVIAEVSLTGNDIRGIEQFGFSYGGPDDIGFNVTGGAFNLAGTVSDFTLDAVFDTARRNSKVQILSVPTILTTHNREATLIVGEAFPIVTSSVQDTGITGFRSQIQFRDIGIELTVTPLIGDNGVIQLEIDQMVDNVLREVTIGGNQQPVIGRKQATSFVSVGDQQLVVLGGLQSDDYSDERRRVAIFGQLPIIGGLFGGATERSERKELLLFIRPTILTTTDDADGDARTKIENLSQREDIESVLRYDQLPEEEEEPPAPEAPNLRGPRRR